jgi:DNA-binding XRE family transcriptional regulator
MPTPTPTPDRPTMARTRAKPKAPAPRKAGEKRTAAEIDVRPGSFAHGLRAARFAHGWMQAKCAELIGRTESTYSDLERGRTDPRWSTAMAVIWALGLDPRTMLPYLPGTAPGHPGHPGRRAALRKLARVEGYVPPPD